MNDDGERKLRMGELDAADTFMTTATSGAMEDRRAPRKPFRVVPDPACRVNVEPAARGLFTAPVGRAFSDDANGKRLSAGGVFGTLRPLPGRRVDGVAVFSTQRRHDGARTCPSRGERRMPCSVRCFSPRSSARHGSGKPHSLLESPFAFRSFLGQ